jgi:acetamidase/formamidase
MSAPISISSHFAPKCPGAWITMRFDEDLDAAAKAALRDMIELVRERGKAVRSRPMKSPDNAAASRESNN